MSKKRFTAPARAHDIGFQHAAGSASREQHTGLMPVSSLARLESLPSSGSDAFPLHRRRGIELIVRYVTSESEMRAGLGGLRSEVRFVLNMLKHATHVLTCVAAAVNDFHPIPHETRPPETLYRNQSRQATAQTTHHRAPKGDDDEGGLDWKYSGLTEVAEDEYTRTINVGGERVGAVIGPKGATIRTISASTGCRIEVSRDASNPGAVTVKADDVDAVLAAVDWVTSVANGPDPWTVWEGTVSRVVDVGASVTIREVTISDRMLKQQGVLNVPNLTRISHFYFGLCRRAPSRDSCTFRPSPTGTARWSETW